MRLIARHACRPRKNCERTRPRIERSTAFSAHGRSMRRVASATASSKRAFGKRLRSAKQSRIVPLTRASTATRRVNCRMNHSPSTGTTSRATRGSFFSG